MLKLYAIDETHFSIYRKLYQNNEVMAYVCAPLDDANCLISFDLLMERLKDAQRRRCDVIFYDDQPVGLIDAKHDAMHGLVEVGVLLLPLFQGKGVAQRAHSQLFERLKAAQWPQRFLARCHRENHKACHLYHSLGFNEISKNTEKIKRWEKK